MVSAKILNEMVGRIREKNLFESEDLAEVIPRSDTLYRHMFSDICTSEADMFHYLDLLESAHYIFILTIHEPDEAHHLKGTDGYVIADEMLLEAVSDKSNRVLENVYASQKRQMKGSQAIIRELFHEIHSHKNTPLGEAMNLSIMITQFQEIIKETPHEYKDDWKEEKLNQLIRDISSKKEGGEGHEYEQKTEVDENATRRAIDTKEYLEAEKMNLNGVWGKAVERYGVQFLVRIHFRKHEFNEVRKLIKQKRIAREEDLRFIRDTLNIMEKRMEDTPSLKPFSREMAELRRLSQLKMNQIILLRKAVEEGIPE